MSADPWRPWSPCSPVACVPAPAAVAGPVHRTARLIGALLVVLGGVPVSLAVCRAPAATRAEVTRVWARLLLRVLGVTISLTAVRAPVHPEPVGAGPVGAGQAGVGEVGAGQGGLETAGGGVLVVANHVSWLDPLVIAATLPSRPLAKREVADWPVVRLLVAGAGALFIDRERLSALPSAVAAVTSALRAGDTVVAFPEGTTWCGRGMGEFRPAVFQAAVDAGAAVRPATLRYREGEATSARACYVGDDSLLASALRVAATRRLTVEVTLFEPVRLAPTGRRPEARAALAGIAEARVRAHLYDRHGRAWAGEGV
ncbi:1-acyl-sn-glycerol-3-phosphate acyltransferase [Nonomuraea sp. K274]|uniref:1-acyl-sn-glycerol-3-phosphate acyltransferase n=1 Tax=Nonomuraea cypriaca TaxID=1187855 RepID=A0A931AEH3_9ACTN|nr:lysophospholipid acyltransferase family protein [Nonomuraea cypriaca]MBF8189609.1 1-acyl-sn-glycerol-3-phosphate acyltransferase [Nonomuraea cypriaca]